MKFSAQWAYGNISDGLYTVMAIPSLVLFCDHFVAHIIKYNFKDMVKVEKISPQQAQSQLQLLNAIAMLIIIIKGKKQSTSNKWHYDKTFALFMQPVLAIVLTLFFKL